MGTPNSTNQRPVLAIIGNGITGITAARTARKIHPHLKIHIISDESKYFYSRTALMYIYMGHMRPKDTEQYARDFYPKNKLNLIQDRVTKIDADARRLSLKSGETLDYDLLLIATGSKPNKFGWPGQDLKGVTGMYSLQDLEQIKKYTDPAPERAVVIGGGLIGIEMAEMFHSRNIPVTFLVREKGYMDYIFPKEESEMIGAEIKSNHIDLQLTTELKEILDNGNGQASGVITSKDQKISCGIVGLTAGVSPNHTLAVDSKIETGRGILINKHFETNVDRIHAAGDCAQFKNDDGSPGMMQQLWYSGRRQGMALGRVLARKALEISGKNPAAVEAPEYDKGIFFNSAKFFNMEYQTYGVVPAAPPTDTGLFWKHPKANRSIRLLWDKNGSDTKITGFNLMGVRYRHELCEEWLRDEKSIEYVVKNLPKANFDPEFYTKHEKDVQKLYKQKFGAKR